MKHTSLIKKIAFSPISTLVLRTNNALQTKFLKILKINFEREILSGKYPQPLAPLPFFRSLIHASKETVDRICSHEFDMLGSGSRKLGKHINWHQDFKHGAVFPPYSYDNGKDIKIPWELSRFQFLPALARAYGLYNEEKYSLEARELIHDWILKNPLGEGVNWKCAMDVAIRACNFALVWYFLKNSSPWLDQNWQKTFLISIIGHGKFIFRNLEYGPGFNSNHFLADITGLLFLGILFPQFREASKWKRKALKEFEREIRAQVYEDGVDFEASIPYHRLVCEFFGYSALLCKENNINLSAAFWARLEKIFEFSWHYTKPNGLAPQIGDNDDGRLFIFEDFYSWERRDHRDLFKLAAELFPLNKKFIQNNGETAKEKQSKAFEKGRIYIMRKDDFYCIVDCGNNGQAGNAGHSHNDTLSFELSVEGEDFIIDPGTYVYTSDPDARNKFRGTRMHNTVMIDNEEMNRFRNDTLFSMHNDAIPTVNKWESDANHDFLDAQHNGYARLRHPAIHRRTFHFDKNSLELEITDYFIGENSKHTAEWNFHFAPGVEVNKNSIQVIAKKNDAQIIINLPETLTKYAEIREDFVSPRYGVKEKAKVMTIKAKIEMTNYEFLITNK